MKAIADGVYRAAWIVPIANDPIENGFFRVIDGRIAEISRWSLSNARDLGDVAVLPGLINAHTHLEFSDLNAPLGYPGNSLPQWISNVIQSRASTTGSLSRKERIAVGLEESTEHGVALVGDIVSIGASVDDWDREVDAPDLCLFSELLGLSESRQENSLQWARDFHRQAKSSRRTLHSVRLGVSPHAPYSVPWSFFKRTLQFAAKSTKRIAMHLAESPEEVEFVQEGKGPFAIFASQMGFDPVQEYPVRGGISSYLREMSAFEHVLVVHGNYLNTEEIKYIASHTNFTTVYCPRTHAYFQHDPHPILEIRRLGGRVILGTDSRASNPDLSVWREAVAVRNTFVGLSPSETLGMITSHSADALGAKEYGRIEVGLPARLIQVPLPSNIANKELLFETLFDHDPLALD